MANWKGNGLIEAAEKYKDWSDDLSHVNML